jgi:Golgi SNAP receptor complex protein 1
MMNSNNNHILQINQLTKDASKLENQIEQKLITLSKLSSRVFSPTSASNDSPMIMQETNTMNSLDSEIERLLQQLTTINNDLKQHTSSAVNKSGNSSADEVEITPSVMYQREQHTQVLQNLQQEFRRIRQQRNRNILLDPSNDNTSSSASSTDNGFAARLARVSNDRDSIINIDAMANSLIDQATQVRRNMSTQRTLISGAEMKLGGLRARFPVVDGLIVRIQQKRQKDMIILSFFIAALIIITFFLL